VSIHAQYSPVDTVLAFEPILKKLEILPKFCGELSRKAKHLRYFKWLRNAPKPYIQSSVFL
jgi:hypothetical protein